MDKLVENHVPIESVVSEPPIQNFPESDYVNVKIEFNNNKKETEVRFSEKKEKSVIIIIHFRYADYIEENEIRHDKKAIIYFGNILVKDYVRLPFENSYDDDDGIPICLFPKAKYELFF
jgi:hypothetical protein